MLPFAISVRLVILYSVPDVALGQLFVEKTQDWMLLLFATAIWDHLSPIAMTDN